MFDCFWILLFPASAIGADAEHDVSAFHTSSSEHPVARIDDPVIATEAAVIALAILVQPQGRHLAFGNWLSHRSTMP